MPTNLEIERKFVVNAHHPEWLSIQESQKWKRLTQSTIHKESGYKLRIRMIEDLDTGERSSFFCFKVSKKWDKHDPSIRDEYEWPVPDRNALYMMIGHGEISKIRRIYTDATGFSCEIDEYEGINAGIITADIESHGGVVSDVLPPFLGSEVTSNIHLSNSTLQIPENAYNTWTPEMKLWYQSLEDGTGVALKEPAPRDSKKSKSFWKRLRKAWKVLRDQE